MSFLYKIFFFDYEQPLFEEKRIYKKAYVNTDYITCKELLKKNNLSTEDVQKILNTKNVIRFYNYTTSNENIINDITSLFFVKILNGEIHKNELFIKENNKTTINTFELYKNKILTLREVKKINNIFSKYDEKDYSTYEELFFKQYRLARKVALMIKNYPCKNTLYSILHCSV
jgi:hypothetical protein